MLKRYWTHNITLIYVKRNSPETDYLGFYIFYVDWIKYMRYFKCHCIEILVMQSIIAYGHCAAIFESLADDALRAVDKIQISN